MKHTRTFVVAALSLMLSAGLAAQAAQGTTGKSNTQSTKPAPPKPAAPTRTAIQITDLPVAASATVSKAYANSTITKATKITKGTVVTYEVAVKQGTKVTNVVLNDNCTTIISPKPKGK
jgi:hypothetical protein